MAENFNEQATIIELRKRILDVQDLTPCTEDEFLLKFLRSRNFECNKTFQLLLNYYKLRVDHPDIYKNFKISAPFVKELCDQNFLMPLPLVAGSPVTVVIQLGKWDTSRAGFNEMYISFHLLLEVLIDKIEAQMNGIVIITDVSNLGFQHVRQGTPSNILKLITLVESSFPAMFTKLHFVNVNFIFKIIFAVAKPLLSKELGEKIILHTDFDALHKYVDPKILPKEFGGTEDLPFDNTESVKEFMENEDKILKLNEFGYKSALV